MISNLPNTNNHHSIYESICVPSENSSRLTDPIPNEVRVLLVDRMPALRRHAKEMIARLHPVCEFQETDSTDTCIQLVHHWKPDVIVLDCCRLDGLKAAAIIWEQSSTARIVFWAESYIEAHIRAIRRIAPATGLYGYILKSSTDDELRIGLSRLLYQDCSYVDSAVDLRRRRELKNPILTDIDVATIYDLCLGLTNRAIAAKRGITLRAAHNRVSVAINKILKGQQHLLRHDSGGMDVFSARSRAVFEALRCGIVNPACLSELDGEFNEWLQDWLKDDRSGPDHAIPAKP